MRCVRQDELDLIQPSLLDPMLNSIRPAVAGVTEAMAKDDGSGVLAHGAYDDRRRSSNR